MSALQPFSTAGFQALCRDWAELCRLYFCGPPKCIVLDCDNTLWGGIVGEDGLHGIRLGETYPGVCYQQFQRQLRQLKQMGFLLAINSKNNEPTFLRGFPAASRRGAEVRGFRRPARELGGQGREHGLASPTS